jgi:hypothetical protein
MKAFIKSRFKEAWFITESVAEMFSIIGKLIMFPVFVVIFVASFFISLLTND